jgi:hypothetical protein
VAVLAAIEVRLGRKLPHVRILMTIAALAVVDSILRVTSSRQVALVAPDLAVLAQQRISRLLVPAHCKQRCLEALLVMTRGAIAAIGALSKLTLVRIGRVTIHATFVRDRLAELDALVTLGTQHFAVLADQRKPCR